MTTIIGYLPMDEHSESTSLSHKRSSAGDCPSMGLGNSSEFSDKQHGEPAKAQLKKQSCF